MPTHAPQDVQYLHRSVYEPSAPEEGGEQVALAQKPVRTGPKVGRNDPCPCGSGKKYKQCHGKLA